MKTLIKLIRPTPKTLRRGTQSLLMALMLATLGGCSSRVNIQTPDGFAVLEDARYDYRAASAEGVVLAVRNNPNAPHGDLAFWSGALHAHLERSGYTATDSSKVVSADGITGRKMRYQVDRGGRPHLFWFTIFVTDDNVTTVEAGGDEAYFKGKDKALEQALTSINVG